MRALLLSAGLGTRLRPVTNKIPKCLVPINGKPLIDYWFEQLFQHRIERILVNTHFQAEQVIDHVNQSKYKRYIDIVHEEELLNTGGTLLKNKNYFNSEPLLLAHADNLCICDWSSFMSSHRNRHDNVVITMMTFETDKPESCGIVCVDEKSIVVEFHEKKMNPPSNLANAAVYIIEPSVVEDLERMGMEKIDFSNDVIPRYMGRIGTHHNDTYHRDVGTVEAYGLAQIESRGLEVSDDLNQERHGITFFVPCYNEEKNILSTLATINDVVKGKNIFCEVIVCDDASSDKSVEIINDAIPKFPQLKIRVVLNKINRGLGFNYFRCSFMTNSKYYILVNGDNVETVESIEKIIAKVGDADMIIPYFGNSDMRTETRKKISRVFSFIVNKITGNNVRYYNGPVLHLTANVRLWRSETVGYGYQAELVCRLLHEGASYLEVEIQNTDRQWGTSKAFSFSNILSVSNSLLHIFWRVLEYNVFKLLTPGVDKL